MDIAKALDLDYTRYQRRLGKAMKQLKWDDDGGSASALAAVTSTYITPQNRAKSHFRRAHQLHMKSHRAHRRRNVLFLLQIYVTIREKGVIVA